VTFQKHEFFFFFALAKSIKLSWHSVHNEEKALTASKEVTLNSMGGREKCRTVGILE